MDFGKVENVENIDFTMPKDHPDNEALFSHLSKNHTSKIYIGCPAWAEKSFVGRIYPPKTKNNEYLIHYSKNFSTIEFNSTYYAIPKCETIAMWREKVSEGFAFCPKVPAQISHEEQMIHSEKTTAEFIEAIKHWQDHLGVPFLVLPPSFSVNRSETLVNYVRNFPLPLAIEFRHPQWFGVNPQARKVFQQLQECGTSMVITDVAGRRDSMHQRVTSSTTMIRFVGNNLHASDYKRLDDWVIRLSDWIKKGVSHIYFFVHQPQSDLAIDAAIYFGNKLKERGFTNIKTPQLLKLDIQQTFF